MLLRAFDGPIAAPSANRSTRISPTTAAHVRAEFGEAVGMILDGGACQVGIESTVIDVSGPSARILRPGSITSKQIADLIGEVGSVCIGSDASQPALSPGQQSVHYAPSTPAYRVPGEQLERVLRESDGNDRRRAAVLLMEGSQSISVAWQHSAGSHRVVTLPRDPRDYARMLYAALRDLDAGGFSAIWIELPPERPEWVAVRDRIIRATAVYPAR